MEILIYVCIGYGLFVLFQYLTTPKEPQFKSMKELQEFLKTVDYSKPAVPGDYDCHGSDWSIGM